MNQRTIMIHLSLISSVTIILFTFLIGTAQVVGNLSQNYDKLHDLTNGYDLDKGPVVYQAYYPDDENVEREKQSFYREPIMQDSWQIQYNTQSARGLQINSINGDEPPIPLTSHRSKINRVVGDDNQSDIENPKLINYNQRLDDAFNILVNTVGKNIQKQIDEQMLLNNLRNQGRLIAKTYIEYWKLVNALAHPGMYNSVRQLIPGHTPRPTTEENIFQPRPQVITYKFSPPIKTHIETVPPADVHKTEKPRVESIKIEGKPAHKIRHHHGEKMRKMF